MAYALQTCRINKKKWPHREKCVNLQTDIKCVNMKRFILVFALAASLWFSSCDYWGDFSFEIENHTGHSVAVSYYEQLQSTEDILPTYEHGEDYEWVHLADTPTYINIKPDSTYCVWYDIGQVGKDWPTEEDTPERYHIVPLWDRIEYVMVGTDTLDASEYSKDKWDVRNQCVYVLKIK